MCHNKEEGDHNYSMFGEDAIVKRKMPIRSNKLVHLSGFFRLSGFFFSEPTH